ncbi:hypothetical protein IKG60_00765 [Candidatus Saccharibacteria bacterium]|nr:hypothetical protein [Candidatus Saccharibacteria bacterium]
MPLKKLLRRKTTPKTQPHKTPTHQDRGYTSSLWRYSNKLSYDDLINAESAIGRTIFGPIPQGHQREFFQYRKNVWIWHESYIDPSGVMQDMTVRYEVRPNGVYKRPGSADYRKIEGVELDNFRKAARIYLDQVKSKLYC